MRSRRNERPFTSPQKPISGDCHDTKSLCLTLTTRRNPRQILKAGTAGLKGTQASQRSTARLQGRGPKALAACVADASLLSAEPWLEVDEDPPEVPPLS